MQVSASGVVTTRTQSNVISGFGTRIEYSNGTIYATTGRAVDAANFQPRGTYVGGTGPVAIDASLDVVMFARDDGKLAMFDRATFLAANVFPVPFATQSPTMAVSCGSDCIAILYNRSRLVIMSPIADPAPLFLDSFE
jgi:hypothetical protein